MNPKDMVRWTKAMFRMEQALRKSFVDKEAAMAAFDEVAKKMFGKYPYLDDCDESVRVEAFAKALGADLWADLKDNPSLKALRNKWIYDEQKLFLTDAATEMKKLMPDSGLTDQELQDFFIISVGLMENGLI